MARAVRITCEVKERIEIEQLEEFQGDLKELSDEAYEKLKTEILDTGFAFPVFIWRDPKPKAKKKIIGGHQRVKTLRRMKAEGIVVPPIPYVVIQAKSEHEAKRRVLQDVSQYGKVTGQGLYDFMKESQIRINDLAASFVIPEIDIADFSDAFFPVEKEVTFTAKPGSKEMGEEEFQEFDHKCPKCSFEWNDKK